MNAKNSKKDNFDKSLFALFLKQAIGNRTQSSFSKMCDIKTPALNKFLNERKNSAPSDEFLLKVAKYADPSVTVYDLFAAAGKTYNPNIKLEDVVKDSKAKSLGKRSKSRTANNDYIAPEDLPIIPDRKAFAEIMTKAVGSRGFNSFSKLCGLSYETVRKYRSGENKSTPLMKSLKAIALYAENGVTYRDLLEASGYTREYLESMGLPTDIYDNTEDNLNNNNVSNNFSSSKAVNNPYENSNHSIFRNLNDGNSVRTNRSMNNNDGRSLRTKNRYYETNNKSRIYSTYNSDDRVDESASNNNVNLSEMSGSVLASQVVNIDDARMAYDILGNMIKRTSNAFERAALGVSRDVIREILRAEQK